MQLEDLLPSQGGATIQVFQLYLLALRKECMRRKYGAFREFNTYELKLQRHHCKLESR